jgi:hypothetical protein
MTGAAFKKRSGMKRQAESKNIVAVRRLYEARGNPDIVKNLLFTRLFGDFEDWHTEPAEIFEAGDRVIGLGFYSARAKATGRRFEARFAHVWTVRDGVIVRLQQCADTVQLAKALRQDFSGEQKRK